MSADRYGIPSTKIIELMKNLQVPFRNVGPQHKIMVMTDTAMVFAVQADGDEIVTVEGLAQDQRLHPLQEAFWKNDAVECGYCTPGMLMSAYGLLSKVNKPTDEQIKKAISGNLCRCTGYGNIVMAIKEAAGNFIK